MPMNMDEREAIEALDIRIRAILPEEYQDCYEDVQPVSMGSAGLKYGADGKVAWNEIWATFCDLAMAGGPPHKGTLLEPASPAEIDARPAGYQYIVAEICRGITMVTGLAAERSPIPGWVRVECLSEGMAGWLLRAIVMENVSARAAGESIDLPAGPAFRIAKEIKNVVTVIAKTSHYWMEHMPRDQQRDIEFLFAAMARESPLVEPAPSGDGVRDDAEERLARAMADAIHRDIGLRRSPHRYAGWLGVECPDVRAAVWLMRTLVASNILSRREETVLFLPVNPIGDPKGETVVSSVTWLHRLASSK